MKLCRKCGEEKPPEEFYKRKDRPDGLTAACKTCTKANSSAYYYEHRDEVLARLRKAYPDNRDQILARHKKWYQQNRKRVYERNRQWWRKNTLRVMTQQRRRRALKAKVASQLTVGQWQWLKEQSGFCCVYCGGHESAVGTLAQEHIVPVTQGGAYTITNIVPACGSCNSSKGPRTPREANMSFAVEINALAHMKQQPLFEEQS